MELAFRVRTPPRTILAQGREPLNPPLVEGLSSGSLKSPASSLKELRHVGLDEELP